jgi:hypothetical protein
MAPDRSRLQPSGRDREFTAGRKHNARPQGRLGHDDLQSSANRHVPYIRQLGSAYQAPGLQQALDWLPDQPDIRFCHLRKASPTIPITLPNAHPFTHNRWVLLANNSLLKIHGSRPQIDEIKI